MTQFHNRTRTSRSIPVKLWREGKPWLIPVYYVMRLSKLASEGIDNSGSYAFADHIYGMRPQGRFGIGRLVDAMLLRLKSARSMRTRYTNAKREIHRFIAARAAASPVPLDILAVPCGLGRELFEVADELRRKSPQLLSRVRFHGIDLDPELVYHLRTRCRREGYDIRFRCGDALRPETYLRRFDFILCTGFTEFLDADLVVRFYNIARNQLKADGRLVTSGMDRHGFSDYLMRNLAELQAHYRSDAELRRLAVKAGFEQPSTYRDPDGLQTMMIATRRGYENAQRSAEDEIQRREVG